MSHHREGDGSLFRRFPAEYQHFSREVAGTFPEGRLDEDDLGAIAVALGVRAGIVELVFPKPIDSFGFEPELARDFAEKILEKAREIDGVEAHVRRVAKEESS
jgi:hypothetical protein